MADSSPMGWLTAEEYQLNRIADDSDEKKIQKAENTAIRKSKLKNQKKMAQSKVSGKKVVKVSDGTPVGRLKASVSKWVKIGASSPVLETIREGYKLPFHPISQKVDLNNNRSSLDNAIF
ncbi:hypothetical protein KUTeg_018863, partial [Tegillarca granosa]